MATELTHAGLFADVDNGANTLNYKVRNGQIAQYNFILGKCFFALFRNIEHGRQLTISLKVVGEKEMESRSVNVRNRDDVGTKVRSDAVVPLDTIREQLVQLKNSRSLLNKLA